MIKLKILKLKLKKKENYVVKSEDKLYYDEIKSEVKLEDNKIKLKINKEKVKFQLKKNIDKKLKLKIN